MIQMNLFIPWVFGDEYLYLSKARNISRGIDVLADVSVGHTYPPLYSYLLSLVMGTDPLISYQQVQWLNFGVSQFLMILSLLVLNRRSIHVLKRNISKQVGNLINEFSCFILLQ